MASGGRSRWLDGFGAGVGEDFDRSSIWAPRARSSPGLTAPAPRRRAGPAQGDAGRVRRQPRQKTTRAYHFGSQGPGDVFSNHTSHSNRLVPVYLFGRKGDLGSVMGENSRYRDPEKIKATYGFLPENTVNPRADYADQSDLYRVQKDAVARGVKHLFIVWFDGLDWPTTQAAAIVKTGKVYTEGKGSGLIFQDYDAGGAAQYGFVVTSPTHDRNTPDVDAQTVVIPPDSLGGGYDAQIAGPNPWTLGPLGPQAPGYLKGSSANAADRAGVKAAGRVLHAYTDSSQSAGEMISGVKSYNNGVNVTDDGRLVTDPVPPSSRTRGGRSARSPASRSTTSRRPAMYAQNVDRDDYQDLAREMLGLPGIMQEARQGAAAPGARRRHGHGLRDHQPGRGPWRPRARTGCRGTPTSPTPTWRRST